MCKVPIGVEVNSKHCRRTKAHEWSKLNRGMDMSSLVGKRRRNVRTNDCRENRSNEVWPLSKKINRRCFRINMCVWKWKMNETRCDILYFARPPPLSLSLPIRLFTWGDSFSICCKLLYWIGFVISLWSSNQFEYRFQHIDCLRWESSLGFTQDGWNFSIYVQRAIENSLVVDNKKREFLFFLWLVQWPVVNFVFAIGNVFSQSIEKTFRWANTSLTFCFESEEKGRDRKFF